MCEEKKLNEKEMETVAGGVGTKMYSVPDVVGMTMMEAEMALSMQTFIGKRSQTGSRQGDAIVTRQSVQPGTMLAERSQILLYAD